jgi:hypothetical protein
MEQLDVIILTSLIAIAFIVFIIATLREFSSMEKNPFDGDSNSKSSKRTK